MSCFVCGCRDKILYKWIKDGKSHRMCIDCMKEIKENNQENQVENGYIMKWKLKDQKDGREWIEEFEEMTLSDFEVVYGNNVYEIIWFTLRKKGIAIL